MRVLMVSDVYFPRVNGVSTSIQTFRRDLAALGCETWLVAPEYPQPWQDDERVLRQPSRYLVFDPEDRMMKPRATLAACTGARGPRRRAAHPNAVRRALDRARRPRGELGVPDARDVSHVLRGIPAPLRAAVAARGSRARFARNVSRWQCNAVDAVVAPSRQLADVLRAYGVTRRSTRSRRARTSTNSQPATAPRFARAHGIAADRPVMLLVGRVAHEKNIGFLLRRARRACGARAERAVRDRRRGPGARRSCAARRPRTASRDNTLFVGYLDRRGALLDCYRAADVFVFASRTETQGLVLLESLALGVPVVSTAVLGTKEVLRDAAGAHRRARGRARNSPPPWCAC